jgi:hypothetical protein
MWATVKLSNYNPNIYLYDMYIKTLTNPMLLCNLVEEINYDDDDDDDDEWQIPGVVLIQLFLLMMGT